jgi:signal peptidase I
MKHLRLLVLSAILIFSIGASKVSAMDVCASANFTAVIAIPPGAYDVFIPAGKDGGVTMALQDIGSQACEQVTYAPNTTGRYGVLVSTAQLPKSLIVTVPDTYVPTTVDVLLLPAGQKFCDFSTFECKVTYEDQIMTLLPKRLSMSADTVRVGLFQDIADDPVKKVTYAVDGKKVYETPLLEPFNERYVGGGEHTLTRKVILASGQTLTDTKNIERGTIADVTYTFVAFLYQNMQLFVVIGVVLGLWLLMVLVRALLRYAAKKRNYKMTHTAGQLWSLDPTKIGAQKNFYDESLLRYLYRHRKLWGGFVAVCAALLLAFTYGVSVFTIDGVSMQPTLEDGSKRLLVRAPRTIASLTRNEYIPSRGTIVVVRKTEDVSFDAEEVEDTFVVKRVIGLPLERVTLKDGILKVYNKQYPEGFVPDDTYKWVKDLTGSEYFSIDMTLKDGEVFVVGDNRDESIDSRFYGAVDASKIVGFVK